MKAGIVGACVYAALFAISVIYFFVFGEDALSGGPIILLTLPWSLMCVLAIDFTMPEILDDSVLPSIVIVIGSFLINISILLWFGAKRKP